MKNEKSLSNRFLDYACLSVSSCCSIQKTIAGKVISTQLIRSSTSSGANYQEATCAESRADFIHKMYVVLKELKESTYWLEIISRLSLLPDNQTNILRDETLQLTNIVARSIKTAKANNIKS